MKHALSAKRITPEGLSSERMYWEWEKLLTLGKKPSLGLQFLRETRWVQYFPELEALIGCEQDPRHHPEGDVWVHTSYALDAFARERIEDRREDMILGLATLCHDFGKPKTRSVDEDGHIHFYGHEALGV